MEFMGLKPIGQFIGGVHSVYTSVEPRITRDKGGGGYYLPDLHDVSGECEEKINLPTRGQGTMHLISNRYHRRPRYSLAPGDCPGARWKRKTRELGIELMLYCCSSYDSALFYTTVAHLLVKSHEWLLFCPLVESMLALLRMPYAIYAPEMLCHGGCYDGMLGYGECYGGLECLHVSPIYKGLVISCIKYDN